MSELEFLIDLLLTKRSKAQLTEVVKARLAEVQAAPQPTPNRVAPTAPAPVAVIGQTPAAIQALADRQAATNAQFNGPVKGQVSPPKFHGSL